MSTDLWKNQCYTSK